MAGINFLIPEILLSVIAMLLLVYGVFRKAKDTSCFIFMLSIVSLIGVSFSVYTNSPSIIGKSAVFMNGMIIFDNLAIYSKILIALSTAAVMFICKGSLSYAGNGKKVFEFPVLMLLATTGMFILVSANDLISMYLGIELMSLSTYVLTAINRDDERSTEAGVKYFVLGALSSCIILYGASLVYGFAGSTNLTAVSEFLTNMVGNSQPISSALLVGIVFVIAGICFKLSAAPFHMWAPDVYEGATKPVVAFITTAPKVAAVVFFVRLMNHSFEPVFNGLQQIVILVAITSMVVGSFAALKQTSIKRLLAYSSIANIGYILIAIAANSQKGIESMVIYLTIYIIMNVGVFAIIALFNNGEKDFDDIADLAGLSKTNPYIAFSMAVLMFSLAGIPPMAGFFGKFFVFLAALDKGMYVLSTIGVVTSVIAAYYYLRIIKIMYFDEKVTEGSIVTAKIGSGIRLLIILSVLFNLFLLLFTKPLNEISALAASSLF